MSQHDARKEEATRTIARCPLCGNSTLKRLPFEYFYENEFFPGRKCDGCGLTFVAVQPDRKMLEEMYNSAYFESDFRCGSAPASYFDSEEPFAREAASALALIGKLTGKKSGRLLEVGCAGGWLLKAAREAGWKVKGVEISNEAAEFARKQLNLDVSRGSLNEAALPPQSFDVIYMADVLEHIPDPVSFTVELRRIVASDGHIVVCGPTALNSLARKLGLFVYQLFNRTRVIDLAPYHLFEYTPQTISRLFVTAGFDLIHFKKKKIPPELSAHGAEAILLSAVDLVNYPATVLFGIWSDRIILCARPRGGTNRE